MVYYPLLFLFNYNMALLCQFPTLFVSRPSEILKYHIQLFLSISYWVNLIVSNHQWCHQNNLMAFYTGLFHNWFIVKDTGIRQLAPPSDGDITTHDALRMAGIFSYLGCSDQTIQTCLQNGVDGDKLFAMRDFTDERLKKELELENNSQIYSVRHLITRAEPGKNGPKSWK